MHTFPPAVAAGCALTASGVGRPTQDPGETIAFAFKAPKDWEYMLPSERWITISGGIPIAHRMGEGFLLPHGEADLNVETAVACAQEGVRGVLDLATGFRH